MRKELLAKTIVIFIAITLLLTSCAKSQQDASALDNAQENSQTNPPDLKNSSVTNMTTPGILPIVEEPVTLKLGIPQHTLITDYTDNAFTKWIEEQTNIKLNFELFPSTDAAQKLEIMISSNSELPEVLMGFGISDKGRFNYGGNGVLLALNNYFKKYSYYFNEGLKVIKDPIERENVLKYITSPDGNIYGFPSYSDQIYDRWSGRWYINKKWLDTLSLDIPKTTDDMYNILKAFKEQDPNRNNKEDEIPLIGSKSRSDQFPQKIIMNAFIYDDGNDRWLVDNGKLDVAYNKEGWREGLRYMRKLCKESLFSPLTFSQDAAQFKSLTDLPEDKPTIVGLWPGAPSGGFSNTNVKKLEYVAQPPLTGPDGICYSPYVPPTNNANTYITKYCKHPEIAFRLFDFFWMEEASLRGRYGIKGEHWNYAPEGSKSLFATLTDLKIPASITQDKTVWGTSNNIIWAGGNPWFIPSKMMDGIVMDMNDPLAGLIMVTKAVPNYIGKKPPQTVDKLIFDDEELDEITDIKNTINTYVNESLARFIVGDLDIEKDWDKYIKDLDQMGLDRYIEIAQGCYNRMNKK